MELDTSTIPSSDISTKPTSLQHPLPAPDTQFLSTILLDTDLSRATNDTFEPDELHELIEDELRDRYHAMISQQKSFQAVVFKAAKTEAEATITRKIAQLINEQKSVLLCKDVQAELDIAAAREEENSKWIQQYDLLVDNLHSKLEDKMQDLVVLHATQLEEVC